MAYLVRWQSDSESVATVRCSAIRKHSLLPDHLHLVGVQGANDPDHPDLHVTALTIRSSDVVYLCDCLPVEAIKPGTKQAHKAAPGGTGEPAGPEPTLTPDAQPAKATEATHRPRRSRAHKQE